MSNNKIIGWLRFNENKDEECEKCDECGCKTCECRTDKDGNKGSKRSKNVGKVVYDKKNSKAEDNMGEKENEAFDELEFEYDLLSIEEKKKLPAFIQAAIDKKKKGKGKKDEDKKEKKDGSKPKFWEKVKGKK